MFDQLPLDVRLLKALNHLEYTQPTEVQSAVIPLALQGKDLLVSAKTGSGKTAAFALPLLNGLLAEPAPQSGTRALILTPTRELAEQVCNMVQALGQFTFIKADTICGGEPFKPQAARLRKNPEILVGTPGRIIEHLDKQSIDFNDLAFLVLDEADRMLDMGFQEDMQRIAKDCPTTRQTLLFSATLQHTGLTSVITASLNNPQSIQLHNHREETHSDITQQIVLANDNDLKDKQLVWLLQQQTFTKAIIFTNTKVAASRLGGFLRYHNLRTGVLQGDLTQEQRKHAIGLLQSGKINILVATDVAARGIDISGIDLVINYDMARSGDDHTHRVGRTGRAGKQGLAISLVKPTEWNLMTSIQRYLKTRFEQRLIKGLEGSYKGPKKLKASGKAAGPKRKKTPTKAAKNKPARHKPAPQKAVGNSVLGDGTAPLKRKPSKTD